ncbi:MAG: hypothetical protein MR270_03700 [Erysipelotrichaceae bacterium]|nr:hypothetical protein [Erysipelotrichaceae bacterium]
MNSKKLLSSLLISLGVFSLVLTGCGNNQTSESSQPSEPNTPSSEEPSTESSQEVSSEESSEVSSEESSEVSSEESSVEESSSEDRVLPEAVTYDVEFNYDDSATNITVWTDYDVEGTAAPFINNISQVEENAERHTVPLKDDVNCGDYYFAVDAQGYIVYASYGTGSGYGGPMDGYYHNYADSDPWKMDVWSLHDEFAGWPETAIIDGVEVPAWNLFDFMVPKGGFVVKGNAREVTFQKLWKQITGLATNAPVRDNTFLENTTKDGALDHLYLSLNEDHKLSVRERLADEIKNADGEQEFATPSKGFESTDADTVVTYTPVSTLATLDDDTLVNNVKGVITYRNGKEAVIQDETGAGVLLYSDDLNNDAYQVGVTIAFNAKKITYGGDVELKELTDITVLERYGSIPAVTPTVVTADNVADVWVAENNYKSFKLVKATVVSINTSKSSVVKIGDTEITLYRAAFPETVSVGDTVDVLCTMVNFNGSVQGKVGSSTDISRYYNVSVDVDGVDGVLEAVTTAHASGDVVELVANNADNKYQFTHWEVMSIDEEGTVSWVIVEGSEGQAELEITVGEADASYRAVFEYAAWNNLSSDMGLSLQAPVSVLNADAGADATAVMVDADAKLHTEGDWGKGNSDSRWRLVIVVDEQGRINYLVSNPANGYGGPMGTGYYVNPALDDYTTNPAFNLLEGYGPWTPEDGSAAAKFEIVVPEGGFVINSHGSAATALLKALGLTDTSDAAVNTRNNGISDDTRLFYDNVNKTVRVYVPSLEEGNYLVSMNVNGYGSETGIGVFVDDETNPMASTKVDGRHTFDNANGWRYCFAVNAEGRIIYASYGFGAGYASPADDFYTDGSITKSTSANQGQLVGDFFKLADDFVAWGEDNGASGAFSHYEALVPTGGFVVSGYNEDANMSALWADIFGETLAAVGNELNINTVAAGTFNDITVRLVEVNGVKQIKVVHPDEVEVPTRDYTSITLDSSYNLNFYDTYAEAVDAKVAALKEADPSFAVPTEAVSEIYYDNIDNRMWGDTGFSSILLTSEANWTANTKNQWAYTMICNAEGKIEWIGQLNNPKANYYLRSATFASSPAYDVATGTMVIPEGGFAYTQWASDNAEATHNIVYSGYDVVRALVMSQVGSAWTTIGTVPTDKRVGLEGTNAVDYGHDTTLQVAKGTDVTFSNIFTGFLDDLTVSRVDIAEDPIFKGKLVVTRERTIKSAIQRGLVKTELAKVLLGEETFVANYNGGGINWALTNPILQNINSLLNDEKTYADVVSTIEAMTLDTSYFGDTYTPLWALINAE